MPACATSTAGCGKACRIFQRKCKPAIPSEFNKVVPSASRSTFDPRLQSRYTCSIPRHYARTISNQKQKGWVKVAFKYQRTFEELEAVASKFWPSELSEIESTLSIIPLLLKTQDQFVSVIGAGAPTLERLFTIIEATALPANLFVKHLVILADFGNEMLQEISEEAESLFPTGEIYYTRRGQQLKYAFRALPHQKFSNKALRIDYAALLRDDSLEDLQRDAIALLMYGNDYCDNNSRAAAALTKCKMGDYLGKLEATSRFVRQRYIWLSDLVLSEVAPSHHTSRNKHAFES